MEQVIFTEEQMYYVIKIWYEGDELFKLVARGLVKRYIAKGLDIDGRFIHDMINLHYFWVNGVVRV